MARSRTAGWGCQFCLDSPVLERNHHHLYPPHVVEKTGILERRFALVGADDKLVQSGRIRLGARFSVTRRGLPNT